MGASGGLRVETGELHAGAAILRSVRGELTQDGDLHIEPGDVGSAQLSWAISDLCSAVDAVATQMESTVSHAGDTLEAAGGAYENTEAANAASFGGPH
jgi:hypothetical protein